MMCTMDREQRNVAALSDLAIKLTAAAHHESGHLVIAAVLGLRLRPEGMSVDPVGEGLACYCKRPDETDASRERVVISTFAGWYAQKRFCALWSIGFPEANYLASTFDWCEARELLCGFSDEYMSGRNMFAVHGVLEGRAEELVALHWAIIETLAETLLVKQWEPLKPLKSGGRWSENTVAKYLAGDDVVAMLGQYGVKARCVSEC